MWVGFCSENGLEKRPFFLGKREFMVIVMEVKEEACQENRDSSGLSGGHREVVRNSHGKVRGFCQSRYSFFIPQEIVTEDFKT